MRDGEDALVIAEEKLTEFLQKAGEIWTAGRQALPIVHTDPPGLLSSDQVFTQLEWRPEDKHYFQDDGDNLVRELEYQGSVVIWDEHKLASSEADADWIVYSFTISDKGLKQGQAR